jgi:hypothetical protein
MRKIAEMESRMKFAQYLTVLGHGAMTNVTKNEIKQ